MKNRVQTYVCERCSNDIMESLYEYQVECEEKFIQSYDGKTYMHVQCAEEMFNESEIKDLLEFFGIQSVDDLIYRLDVLVEEV